MSEIVQSIAETMNNALGAPLTVLLLSIIPIAEARFAIPFGISMGLSPMEAFGWAFLGSSLMAPILLIVFIPLINALSKTKFFAKIGKFLYDKFEKKSQSLADTVQEPQPETDKKPILTKTELKKVGGTALFVAVPLPLTGVWTGSAVASILKIGFVKSLIGVIVGNAVACGIITLISFLFKDYVTYITLAFFIIAVTVVVVLVIKFILYKPKTVADDAGNTTTDDSGSENKD
ncbi:MAG: small multi-drug export protein [Clostridiales bacterium]|nr:small multi-drug export protein [Clostridiales bacterium]